jgi:hypothetical protein
LSDLKTPRSQESKPTPSALEPAGGIAYAMAVMNSMDLPLMAKAYMSSQLVQELYKLNEQRNP